MSLRILRAGVLTTVQDLGRAGMQRHGVAVGGAMDTLSLRIANWLVGNDAAAAALEITLLGPSIEFEEDSLIALCGGDFSPRVGDRVLPMDRPILLRGGTSLTCGPARQGCRAYLAVAGGIDVPQVLGSRSTYLRAATGGHLGRALQTGDLLPIGQPATAAQRLMNQLGSQTEDRVATVPWSSAIHVDTASPIVVQAIRGSEFERLTSESQQRFWSAEFQVSSESDRMGYRLSGVVLNLADSSELLSTAVCPGTIQLPLGGEPILLMMDCATTGGYAKVAHVASADLPRIAQLRPGDRFQLREITIDEAQRMLRQSEEALRCLKASLTLKFSR